MHPVSPATLRAQPWEVGDAERPTLLAWFLNANLADDAAFEYLLEVTGRRPARSHSSEARAAAAKLIERGMSKADLVYPGRESGAWKVPVVVSRSNFVRIYSDLQGDLREALADWERAKNEQILEQRELFAALALGRIREERADVTPLEVERDPATGEVLWPTQSSNPKPARRSVSLAGELAIALYDEMLGAKKAGLCKVCLRPWLSPLRKDRQLCGRPECFLSWRNAHRAPEDPAKVYERVLRARGVPEDEIAKRSRARRAKGGTGHGKTRTR